MSDLIFARSLTMSMFLLTVELFVIEKKSVVLLSEGLFTSSMITSCAMIVVTHSRQNHLYFYECGILVVTLLAYLAIGMVLVQYLVLAKKTALTISGIFVTSMQNELRNIFRRKGSLCPEQLEM